MIISASRRTDIPCYYSEWLLNRLREGFVLTRNPMNYSQISKTFISPELVECIVFWTKDAKNMLPYLNEIDKLGYRYYFQYTLTPYGREIEKNLRDKEEIIKAFIELSEKIGREKVVWRYDPIIVDEFMTADWHKKKFQYLCSRLADYTENVTISFVDNYRKLGKRAKQNVSENDMLEIGRFVGETAKSFGMKAKICCEQIDLSEFGVDMGGCIDREVLEKICGPLNIKQDKTQRTGCLCVESVDIGAYNSCLNGCDYCYANHGFAAVERNVQRHNQRGALLVGEVAEGEIIRERKIKIHDMNFGKMKL